MKSTLALTLTLTSIISLSHAADWANWRGPTTNGTNPDAKPPTTWSATKNIAWKTPIPGRGSSSPVILGDLIFLTTAIDTTKKAAANQRLGIRAAGLIPVQQNDRRRRRPSGGGGGDATPKSKHQFLVLCLDRKSGDIRWQKSVNELVPHSGHHGDHGYASASAIADDRHVYAHFGSRGTFCLTHAGDLVWSRTDLGQMTTRGGFGDGSSPALHGDKLVIPWDHEGQSYITALNKTTGKTLWKTDRDNSSSWTTPLIVEHGGKHQVIHSGEGFARAYDLDTGKELWRADGQTGRPCATPVTADGVVYIGSGFRGSFFGAYKLDGASGDITDTDNQLWTITSGTPDVPSPVLSNGRLYFHSGKDGILSCVDAKTGKPHYTRERIEGLSRVYASPVAANGHVYLTGRDGTTVVIKDADKLKIVTTNSLGEPVDATPALVGNQLFIRSASHLYCISK